MISLEYPVFSVTKLPPRLFQDQVSERLNLTSTLPETHPLVNFCLPGTGIAPAKGCRVDYSPPQFAFPFS